MSKHLIRAADLSAEDEVHIRHPLNDRSELFMTRLSDRAGLERAGVNLSRIPPGREAFVPHAHSVQEEWVYVVRGRGRALIGEREHTIAAGDFLGFPIDGTVHHLKNDSDEDLVVLQGGERTMGDIGHFPTLNKVGFTLGDPVMHLVDADAIEKMPFDRWVVSSDDGD